jgi:hypothetical protein
MENATRDLIMDVMAGNPGAFTIILSLMAYPTWPQLLYHLKARGVVGSKLWRIVKDDYRHNIMQFIDNQLQDLAPERARALRALTEQDPSAYN